MKPASESSVVHRHQDPAYEVQDYARTEQQNESSPDDPHDRRINVEIPGYSGAYSGYLPVGA